MWKTPNVTTQKRKARAAAAAESGGGSGIKIGPAARGLNQRWSDEGGADAAVEAD